LDLGQNSVEVEEEL